MTTYLDKVPPMGATSEETDPMALFRFHNPAVGDWFVIEAEKLENGDIVLFGYARILEAEFGTELLSILLSAGFCLDDEFKPMRVSQCKEISQYS